jgi:hypothetical protein
MRGHVLTETPGLVVGVGEFRSNGTRSKCVFNVGNRIAHQHGIVFIMDARIQLVTEFVKRVSKNNFS